MQYLFLSRRRALAAAATAATMFTLAGCSAPGMATGSGSGSGSTTTFRAMLSGASEVPPTQSSGTGNLEASLDKATHTLRWKMTYSGLTGPATAAHFHGPALPGTNAGVVVPFPNAGSPIDGQATLSPAQTDDLMAGKWYVNVHTERYPAGEIRGQVMAN